LDVGEYGIPFDIIFVDVEAPFGALPGVGPRRGCRLRKLDGTAGQRLEAETSDDRDRTPQRPCHPTPQNDLVVSEKFWSRMLTDGEPQCLRPSGPRSGNLRDCTRRTLH